MCNKSNNQLLTIANLDKNNLKKKRIKINKSIKLNMIQNGMFLMKQIKFQQLILNQFFSFKIIKFMFIIVTNVKLMSRWVSRVPNVNKKKLNRISRITFKPLIL